MHELHDHICNLLSDRLQKRHVVVFYDPSSHFKPLFDEELASIGEGGKEFTQVQIGNTAARLTEFAGSFFALREVIEPLVSVDEPDPLVIYLPGTRRDPKESILMEIEKAGITYEPQLKQLARQVLNRHFTDGQIDGLLKSDQVGYRDIVSFLEQASVQTPSILKSILGNLSNENLLALWIESDLKDPEIEEKSGAPELLSLLKSWVGLDVVVGSSLADARARLARYVLVADLRADVVGELPNNVASLPHPSLKDHVDRCRAIVRHLRERSPNAYEQIADKVQEELDLGLNTLTGIEFIGVDTFRFEERALLEEISVQIVDHTYDKIESVIELTNMSFWLARNPERRLYWDLCSLLISLGQRIRGAAESIKGIGEDPAKWVDRYATDDGWWRIDALHRSLETTYSRLSDEPEAGMEAAVTNVRLAYDDLLKRMAEGFTQALASNNWQVGGGILGQTDIYPTFVERSDSRIAYFWVDAMRFEMGRELEAKLGESTADVSLKPAVAALPTITPVGMAALLPGAATSFSVRDENHKLGATIDGTFLPSIKERLDYLKIRRPDAVEYRLQDILDKSSKKITDEVGAASLVVVRSQEIDSTGEAGNDSLSRPVMENVIDNLSRAIKKLGSAGVERFVVTADHGHQFGLRKEDDMKIEAPGGDTVELHRRSWIGRGGSNPVGAIRVAGVDLGYDSSLEFVFPIGLGVFKAGGGLAFHHGGTSLQELIVPVLDIRLTAKSQKTRVQTKVKLLDAPDAITNRVFVIHIACSGDMFTTDETPIAIALISNGQQVGAAALAIGADFRQAEGIVLVPPGVQEITVGMMLKQDDVSSLKIVVVDPQMDGILDQSPDIPVRLLG